MKQAPLQYPPIVPLKCDCGLQIPTDGLQKHINECQPMLNKYQGFVRAYVTLKQDATSSGPLQMQLLQNILTLTYSFISDVNIILPRQQAPPPV